MQGVRLAVGVSPLRIDSTVAFFYTSYIIDGDCYDSRANRSLKGNHGLRLVRVGIVSIN